MFKWTETLFAKCLFAVLCVVWCVYTLYIVMSERSAAARICGFSLSLSLSRSRSHSRALSRSLSLWQTKDAPYRMRMRANSLVSLFRVLNSRINIIVDGAKQITSISHWLSSLCATIWCFPRLQFRLQWEVALARRCSCCGRKGLIQAGSRNYHATQCRRAPTFSA